jgi:hypothetical protein
VDHRKYWEQWASTPWGHLLPPTPLFAETTTYRGRGQGHWLLPEIPVAPPRGPSSTSSSISVVATVGDIDSTSQGAHHRRLLQLRWWLLPEIPTAPLRGPAIDVFFNFGGGCCRRYQEHLPGAPPSTSSSTSMVAAAGGTDSTSQGPRHRCLLQLRWWLLPEIPAAPPRGPTIDVFFNFSGDCCWRYR